MPTTPLIESVSQLSRDAASRGATAFWLIDQSALPLPWLRQQLAGQTWTDLLGGSRETSLNGATPVLVQLDANAKPAYLAYFAHDLHRMASMANAVSLLVACNTLPGLQAQLAARARVQLPDHLHAVLRFFDTRCLPLLPRLLTAGQYNDFMAGIEAWLYLDRRGALQRMPLAAISRPDAPRPTLQLSAEQETMLIDDGLTDAVIDMLLTQHHPALQDKSPPEQFDATAPLVQAACGLGLNEPVQAFAFAAKGLEEGPGFHEREPWQQRLACYRRGECSLEDALGLSA